MNSIGSSERSSSEQALATPLGLDHVNLHVRAGRQLIYLMKRADYEPPPDRHARGLNHVCLLVEPTDPDRLMSELRARGVPITGTRGRKDGPTFSVYVEDPDGHGIELEQRRR
ncbi:MAG TPA: VOC family protein [Chloroflexota bacterium]|nr:VOC family protein [Chloroflexota bacterium]